MTLPWLCAACAECYPDEGAADACCPDGEALRTPGGDVWRYDADAARARRDPACDEYAAHDAQRYRMHMLQGRTSGGRRL